MNRLREYFSEPPEPDASESFWLVSGENHCFIVSAETARAIERAITRRWRPRWLVFRDLDGSYVRVRCREVDCLEESTASQRAAHRRFRRARKREEKADRSWDDTDD